MRHWDWDGMVEANRGRLIGLFVGVFAMLGPDAGKIEAVRRGVWRAVLAQLLPMESALRRLIFVMARDLGAAVLSMRAAPGEIPQSRNGERKPVFRLTDPLRNPDPKPCSTPGRGPRILFFDEWGPGPENPTRSDDDLLDAAALRNRLAAMKAALDDLPGQARRLARWYARRDRMRAATGFSRHYPLRSGRPPGHRDKGKREVDEALATCHDLALRCRAMVEADG